MIRYKIYINNLFHKEIYEVKREDFSCLCTMREGCFWCDYWIIKQYWKYK